jgi:hypothetical protein
MADATPKPAPALVDTPAEYTPDLPPATATDIPIDAATSTYHATRYTAFETGDDGMLANGETCAAARTELESAAQIVYANYLDMAADVPMLKAGVKEPQPSGPAVTAK